MKRNLFILFLAGLLFWTCKPLVKFPKEPRLTFISLEKVANWSNVDDKALLKLSFTDGDGNIGLNSEDNAPPFDTGSIYKNNFFVTYYAKRNGEFIAFPEFAFNARLSRFFFDR